MQEKLPKEIISNILSFLPAEDLFRLQRVSKLFQLLINNDNLWKPKVEQILDKSDEKLFEKTMFHDMVKLKSPASYTALRSWVSALQGRDGKFYSSLSMQVKKNETERLSKKERQLFWKLKVNEALDNLKLTTYKAKCRDLMNSKKRIRDGQEDQSEPSAKKPYRGLGN